MLALEIGTVMQDGTVYAGVSPQTGKMLFVMPQDAPLMDYDATVDHVKALNREKTYSHDDWRIPTVSELGIVHQNKEKGALNGTFNEAGLGKPFRPVRGRISPGQYRASDWGGQAGTRSLIFGEGTASYMLMMEPCSVRYIREGEAPDLSSSPSAQHAESEVTGERQNRLKKLARARKPVIISP